MSTRQTLVTRRPLFRTYICSLAAPSSLSLPFHIPSHTSLALFPTIPTLFVLRLHLSSSPSIFAHSIHTGKMTGRWKRRPKQTQGPRSLPLSGSDGAPLTTVAHSLFSTCTWSTTGCAMQLENGRKARPALFDAVDCLPLRLCSLDKHMKSAAHLAHARRENVRGRGAGASRPRPR